MKVTAFVFVAIAVGVFLAQGLSLRWMGLWWIWPLIAAFAALAYLSTRGTACSAGTEWARRDHGGWVRLYELTKITAHYRSNSVHLDFTDRDGRIMQISASDLQHNPDLWDLVYNGILHSVIAGGAETNGRLHSALQVPRPWPQQDNPGERRP